MIITKLNGGLGNQMFQYAIGYNLAKYYNTILKIEISNLGNKNLNENHTPRLLELDIFNIKLKIASENETLSLIHKKPNSLNKLKYKFLKVKPHLFFKYTLYQENPFEFISEIYNHSSDLYLEGYWQNELYFKNISEEIRRIFSFKNKPNEFNQNLISHIQNSNSISVHIRRGDYIKNCNINKVHGVCSIEYYLQAIRYIKNKINNPIFYFFSDDIQWVKGNFNITAEHYFISQNNNENSFEDLRLMSYCKHNIIANSSYSWWGAWLNNNSKKIVIAPKIWMNNPIVESNKFLPNDWVII